MGAYKGKIAYVRDYSSNLTTLFQEKEKPRGTRPLGSLYSDFAPALPLDKAGAYGIINIKRALLHGG